MNTQGLATTVAVDRRFLWSVPDRWSLEQAATVPVVYTTAYYALVVRGRIRRGDRVLVHSGSGGVGQAAIAIAIDSGCEVFTTVGSKEKKEYLKATFPQLEDDHFCNSRDTSFETDILRITKGKGTLYFLGNKIPMGSNPTVGKNFSFCKMSMIRTPSSLTRLSSNTTFIRDHMCVGIKIVFKKMVA